MSCTAFAPNLSARDKARHLYEAIPPGLFKVENDTDRVAWRVSPEPFALSPATYARIESLGSDLLSFYRGLNSLYNRSARGTAPAFIAEYLDLGKPESIIKLARQNRFKQDIPGVIRPDLILTESGFIASELDSIPGGMGFVGAMTRAYCQVGLESVGGVDGIAQGFAAMLASAGKTERPTVGIVVSEESADYRAEMSWLAQRLRELELANAWVITPQEMTFTEDGLFAAFDGGELQRLDVLYRNFELFDLLNVPKQELMLYAARHNKVKMTPPPKPQLEEKLAFALLHHPLLATLWQAELGREAFDRLRVVFPQTWLMDARPLPPQGVIYGLEASGLPISDWRALIDLGKSERDFVVKPSGFSELAWGSRGVRVANDLTKEDWTATIDEAMREFSTTPRILQRFHKGRRIRQSYYSEQSEEVKNFDGRVRLCPYYFVVGDEARLGGILATVAPADKRLIHGMSDAVMASCMIANDGA